MPSPTILRRNEGPELQQLCPTRGIKRSGLTSPAATCLRGRRSLFHGASGQLGTSPFIKSRNATRC